MDKEIISCVCMTCGIRNDHSHPDGFCQNGHDDWLEYGDVKAKNQFFKRACKITGMTEKEFTERFLNNARKYFYILNPRFKVYQTEIQDVLWEYTRLLEARELHKKTRATKYYRWTISFTNGYKTLLSHYKKERNLK